MIPLFSISFSEQQIHKSEAITVYRFRQTDLQTDLTITVNDKTVSHYSLFIYL